MSYIYYIGIDVSKEWFDVAIFSEEKLRSKEVKRYDNNQTGIAKFLREEADMLSQGLSVLEATGGYELAILIGYSKKRYAVHRASGYQARQFANSLPKKTKTDKQDAKTLARYAYERREILALFILPSEEQRKLTAYSTRIDDLVKERVADKNRLQNPLYSYFQAELRKKIVALTAKIEKYRAAMRLIITSNEEMVIKVETLVSMKGISETTAHLLMAKLPELGKLCNKQIAALAGLAPHERSSGKNVGQARVCGGRVDVRKALHLCALSAARWDDKLKAFYENLLSKGKCKMAATCAVA